MQNVSISELALISSVMYPLPPAALGGTSAYLKE